MSDGVSFTEWMDASGIIAVHAVPKSPKNRIEGLETDAAGKRWLKIRVTAAAEDGKANKALIKLLAKHLNLPASALQIIAGENSRYKRIRVERR